MKNLFSAFFFLFCTALIITSAATAAHAQLKPGVRKIMIDPGHGGRDGGATNRKLNVNEKDIVLKVAFAFGDLINKNYPDVEVLYTRKTDVLIDLAQRGKMANDAGVDLFVSIHINSAEATSARGTETLVMGTKDAGKNLETAMRENNAITYEEDYSTTYMGFNPNSSESYIMFSLMQYSSQEQSIMMADIVQKHFTKMTNMPNRGIKQLPALVLWRTAMPSVLTEFGFLSNETDAKYISSAEGIRTYATCLFNAFSEYKTRIEGNGNMIVVEPSSVPAGTGTATAGNGPVIASDIPAGKVIYRIQVSSSTRKIAKNSATFGPYRGEVKEMIIDNRYKYFTKESTSYREIVSLLPEVKKSIKDAFIVAFIDDKPIAVDQARRINNEL